MTADRHPVDIPSANLRFSFSRSAGPGGQNVNKVETAVQLWFDPSSLPEPVRRRLRRLAGNRWTAGGEVTIRADRYRTREMNRTDALRRLADLLERAAEKPRTRLPTRPGLGAARRRLEAKKRRSLTKRLRSRPQPE